MGKKISVTALDRLAFRKEQILYSAQRLQLETDDILLSLFKLIAVIDELKKRQEKERKK